jgi:hypothetical protein
MGPVEAEAAKLRPAILMTAKNVEIGRKDLCTLRLLMNEAAIEAAPPPQVLTKA